MIFSKKIYPKAIIGLIAILIVAIAACSGDTNEQSATSVPTIESPADSTSTSMGHQLFTSFGCGACHGASGEGTTIAPALSGHSSSQVKRQARAPVGLMPIFPPSIISNAELDSIAEYISTMSGDHAHMAATGSADVSEQQHWMALFALEADAGAEAVHHIDHIIELVSGEHMTQMQNAKEAIGEGRIHDAAHVIETMLAGVGAKDLTPSEMHSDLARSSVLIDDIDEALHHLDHLSPLIAEDPAIADQVHEIQELLKAGNVDDAAHELEELIGVAHEEEHVVEEEPAHGH